ncbi:uncharacterized protein AC631_00567 [Debaryomyces fabryi]|uniref:ATP-dependent helicase IRC3 n=1 Tax=Debaryomyces fabryi TaxID=58627 RepID=A0A0V1Q5H1_9ASCO|nr:uncharacterized protein AC631_00567 [Debaryomyces fabryi]KSA03755.1 hypothetical protein AC631_00567 [Debaryomyces fabryi]CUM53270.1 unnamed protein product [Debaryomyces fabryi]
MISRASSTCITSHWLSNVTVSLKRVRFLCFSGIRRAPLKLRDYQVEAIDSVHNAISRGINRSAVVLATGGGKTVVFSHLIPQIKPSSPDRGNKTLVLAHKEELVRQAADSISEMNPDLKVDIDMRRLKPSSNADVIVASVPTLIRMSRLSKYDPKEFKTIILDECHHAPANSWSKILRYFDADSAQLQIYVIGFTATMERSDGKSLAEIFDEIVFERNLLEMVQNKELADVKFSSIDVDVDLAKVATKKNDYEINSLSQAMNDSEVNLLVALSYSQLRKEFKFKSTLIFCVDISHCKTLCGVLQREGINAQYVTGETAKHERQAIIEDFKNGLIEVLCNVQVFTEGTDMPNIDSLFLARPTKSRPLLVQMIGRGLRLHKSKTHCHVVDIAGTRGTGIQSVPTLFSLPPDYIIHGKSYEELVKEKEEYDEEMEKIRKEEILERERNCRLEELATHNKMNELKMKSEEVNLKFKTFDGFMALEAHDSKEYQMNKNIDSKFRSNRLSWIKLAFDMWGHQLGNDDFYLVKKCYLLNDDNGVYFRLTLNKFASHQQRVASQYKCGKTSLISEIMVDLNLQSVLAKAETFSSQFEKKFFKNFSNSTAVSDRQHTFLYTKLSKRARLSYDFTPDLQQKLAQGLKGFTKERASNLIFAHKYSLLALWVKWELQKLLGPDKKSQTSLKKIVNSGRSHHILNPEGSTNPPDYT